MPQNPTFRDIFVGISPTLRFHHHPKKHRCLKCELYKHVDAASKEALKEDYENHQRRKEQARAHKRADKQKSATDKSYVIVTFGLEKVLYTPQIQTGEFYSRKLATYTSLCTK